MPDHLPVIGVVIPCYNEESVLETTISKMYEVLRDLVSQKIIAATSFAFFVDDGSRDKSWEIIEAHHSKSQVINGLRLGGNAGHQNAILAGMLNLIDRVDAVITMDCDLQDDVSCFPKMIEEFRQGSEVVFGVRKNRESDGFFKKHLALGFYKFMELLGTNAIPNHADFRLVSNKALKYLEKFEERNLFLRGIFPSMKLKSSMVYYDRLERIGGEPKYTFWKSLALAWNGITSFSVGPLHLITVIGAVIFLLSIFFIFLGAYLKFIGLSVPGWPSIIISVLFMGGIQIFALGIIGEYISKIYLEVKARPRFLADRELFHPPQSDAEHQTHPPAANGH